VHLWFKRRSTRGKEPVIRDNRMTIIIIIIIIIIIKVKVKLSLCLTKHHAMKTYWEWR
jgi:hypothetical protein